MRRERGEVRLAPSDLAAAQAEGRALRRQLAVAEQERDILKKAVRIFSRLERCRIRSLPPILESFPCDGWVRRWGCRRADTTTG